MSWFNRFKGTATPTGPAQQDFAGNAAERLKKWESALQHHHLPDFVKQRLADAGSGKLPWIATMTPAELAQTHRHRVRPIAMVSGTCWYHFGYSWTNGHTAGWHAALSRMQEEAVAAGANAIVDVRMRKIDLPTDASMDFTVIGTAIRIEGMPPSPEPVVATVTALEFMRLLEAGIVPSGIAIGAHYEWLQGWDNYYNSLDAKGGWVNQPLTRLGNFWEQVRKKALLQLRQDVHRQGNGALAHIHFGQLLKSEDDKNPSYLGRHIVIATVIDSERYRSVPHDIRHVVDMCDGPSPLNDVRPGSHNVYDTNQEEGSI
ncbi:heavy metal-binding domain-containing protein [Dyella acidiphila]|uniref:Heavy metal-binding domain-containing protein n=1 Tax=Dyella acidiphila TaxID=2775866 RepID=A0ABR9GFR8_9GAMM|nr:heavy metal-binding domain-containing protein [Dyella acidiphila]MBE1162860.1 heavy metal-binding domain-containing protein [Dyella acidiphila]